MDWQEAWPAASSVTDHARTRQSRTMPSTVYRFYDDKTRIPERFSTKEGWVADNKVFNRLRHADVDESDIVGEGDARQIIRTLTGEY